MYDPHLERPEPDSTDWCIYSPLVPVFRSDDGTGLPSPWLLSFITCAAPYACEIGQPWSGDLLQQQIHRVLAVAEAFGHTSLILGAWGCGAFGHDTFERAEISAAHWKTNSAARFPTSCLRSPTGRGNAGFSAHFAKSLLQRSCERGNRLVYLTVGCHTQQAVPQQQKPQGVTSNPRAR